MSERATTVTAAPPSARSSAMARPMLRAPPVTMATRPFQFAFAHPRAHAEIDADRLRRSRAIATASASARSRVQPPKRALSWNFARVSRRATAARARRRACAASLTSRTLPSLQRGADMAGEIARIRVVRIDDVGDLARRARRTAVSCTRSSVNCSKPGVAVEEAGGDAIGHAEFCGIAVGRRLLQRERLPQAVHDALADVADRCSTMSSGLTPARRADARNRCRAGSSFRRHRA